MRRNPPDTSSHESAVPVIWTVSISRLTRLLSDIIPEFDAQAEIRTFNLGFEEATRQVRERLKQEPCDVIIAAGSNGAYLKGRVGKPIVLVKANGFDLMQALARARKVSDHIGLITHQTELPEFTEFQNSFQLKIPQRTYITAEDARSAVAELAAQGVKVVVGTGLAAELADEAGLTGVLLYSADSVRTAFESALDIARATQSATQQDEVRQSKKSRATQQSKKSSAELLLGQSAVMQTVRATLRRYAASDATLCIRGETGTGKELAARAVHAHSPRHAQPFVAVNCGALTESLLESELFGYDEGAFTGSRRGGRVGLIEAADGGTLLLDEIGEMPLALQTRLLRVLEERELLRVGSSRTTPVNIRVIASTHRNLAAQVQQGLFRRDLFYRLNVLTLELPPLRQRLGDLPDLAQYFLETLAPSPAPRLSASAMNLLLQHDWPGNVRELRNVMQRISLQVQLDGGAPEITVEQLQITAPELGPQKAAGLTTKAVAVTLKSSRGRPSGAELAGVLEHVQGNHLKAAEILGVSRTTLWRWLRLNQSGTADSGQ